MPLRRSVHPAVFLLEIDHLPVNARNIQYTDQSMPGFCDVGPSVHYCTTASGASKRHDQSRLGCIALLGRITPDRAGGVRLKENTHKPPLGSVQPLSSGRTYSSAHSLIHSHVHSFQSHLHPRLFDLLYAALVRLSKPPCTSVSNVPHQLNPPHLARCGGILW